MKKRKGIVEGDELLMSACLSVQKRWYNIVTKNGSNYRIGKYSNRRPSIKEDVINYMLKSGKVYGRDYELELMTECTDYVGARISLLKTIRQIYRDIEVDRLDFYVGPTDGSNFRYKSAVTQPYKGHRTAKPEIYNKLRDYLIIFHGAQEIQGYEADDALGIYREEGDILVHIDKDIDMIAAQHYNHKKRVLYFVDELGELWVDRNGQLKGNGKKFFYAQLLVGDKTDNIPALAKYKYGPKKVVSLLQHLSAEEGMLDVVMNEYKIVENERWMDRLEEQADLCWICRNKEEKGRDYIRKRIDYV